jgi:hypothetical protein
VEHIGNLEVHTPGGAFTVRLIRISRQLPRLSPLSPVLSIHRRLGVSFRASQVTDYTTPFDKVKGFKSNFPRDRMLPVVCRPMFGQLVVLFHPATGPPEFDKS